MKICRDIRDFVTVWHFTFNSMVPLYCLRRYKFAVEALLCDIEYFYIVGSDMLAEYYTGRIGALPLQQWLRKRTSVLSYT
jgi:hypothetical protein